MFVAESPLCPARLVKNAPPASIIAPAIRGATNFGWVQLPRGTPVELIRHNGDRLWVRWDGTVLEVPRSAVASGALVIRHSSHPT